MSKLKVLDNQQIDKIIKRLAYQILERNYQAKKIILAGINKNGMNFAQLLKDQLMEISTPEVDLVNIVLNPAKPTEEIDLSVDAKSLKNQNIILVDDVANTGRTIFFAFKPLIEILPKSVQVAVLVDRKHKSFPVLVDFVGLSLATTLKENIKVTLQKKKSVHLE